MTPEQINEYAKNIFAQNVQRGWWDDMDRCVFQTLQLVNTEIAEATEGDRKDLMDDHLPHRKMAEVELADTVIRLLDLAGRYEWVYRKHPPTFAMHEIATAKNTAARHLWLTASVCTLAVRLCAPDEYFTVDDNAYFSHTITAALQIAEIEGYDLIGAIDEKLEYNKARADHDRKNRAQAGGKKY